MCAPVVSESVTGRVIRRYSVYSQFYFLELGLAGQADNAMFPVIVKADVCSVATRVRAGDVVTILGAMESDHAVSTLRRNKCFEAREIMLVEPWDMDRYGSFLYLGLGERIASDSQQTSADHTATATSPLLTACVQCQNDVVGRVHEYLSGKFPSHKITLSHTPVTVSQDRLLLVWGVPAGVVEAVLADPVLAYAVSRVYSMATGQQAVGLTVDDAIERLLSHPSTLPSNATIRIHSFPKFIPMECIGSRFAAAHPSVKFTPKEFTHVLSVVYADGVFYASIGVDEGCCGTHLAQGVNARCLSVSKAAAKILEATTRFDLIDAVRSDTNGKVAIDIGASPGGWSYYLRLVRGCSRVLAVDMGRLADPVPDGVEHWRMKGQQAVDTLLESPEMSSSIACYACDMNCDLTDTVKLFLHALPLLTPGGIGILTFKRTIKNTVKWETLKTEGMRMLTECVRIAYTHEVHLIANTPNETTVLIALV